MESPNAVAAAAATLIMNYADPPPAAPQPAMGYSSTTIEPPIAQILHARHPRHRQVHIGPELRKLPRRGPCVGRLHGSCDFCHSLAGVVQDCRIGNRDATLGAVVPALTL